MAGKPRPPRPIAERFEEYVDRSAGPDACHAWLGTVSKGRPLFSVGKKSVAPRRLQWLLAFGEEPLADRRVWVTCGDRLCMNPAHLRCQTYEEHFWRLVDKSAGEDACWPWTAAKMRGYGQFWLKDRRVIAHRYAYEAANGSIPESDVEILVMHLCDNPPCCNPRHLRLGTDADNIADMWNKGRSGPQQAKAKGEPWGRHRPAWLALQSSGAAKGEP